MLRYQFLCHILKALFLIKIALKLSYFCKKMQNFRALGAPPPDPRSSGGKGLYPQTPSLWQQGASPPDPHWPPVAGGSAPRPPKQPPHCEFLATRLTGRIHNMHSNLTLPRQAILNIASVLPFILRNLSEMLKQITTQ